MLNFWKFCEERESIRIKKENGEAKPWTEDVVLRVNHFTNIDRINDRGTKALLKAIADLPEDLKFYWTFVYRISGSNEKLLNNLDLLDEWSIRDVPNHKITYFNTKPYSLPCFPKGKGIAIDFLQNWIPQNLKALWLFLDTKDNWGMQELAVAYAEKISEMTGYNRMSFHMGEITKDLSIIFPDKVSSDSEVNLGPGAKKGLRKIGVKANQSGVKELINSEENTLGLNFNSIEHASCEYGKYMDVWKSRKHRNRVREELEVREF